MKNSYVSKSTKLLDGGLCRSLSLIALTWALILLTIAQGAAQIRLQWHRIGPNTPLQAVAADPFDPNIIFAAGVGGVYRISNNGRWTTLFGLGHASDLSLDRQKQNVIYAASNGVYKSTDAGSSWTSLNSPPAYMVQVSPRDQNLIVAADPTFNILVSLDGGTNWQTRGFTVPLEYTRAITIDPQDPNKIYLSYDLDLPLQYRSNNGGFLFEQFHYPFPYGATSMFKVHPRDSNIVYASACSGLVCSETSSLFKSTNGGVSWIRCGPMSRATAIAVSPHDAGNIYYSNEGGEVYRSLDNGATFTKISSGLPLAAIRDLEFEDSGTFLYAATQAGVFRMRVR